jgi:hypothetical protein
MIERQRKRADGRKLAAAVVIGFGATLACAATAPGEPRSAEVHPLTAPGPSASESAAHADTAAQTSPPPAAALAESDSGAPPADAAKAGDARCPYGSLEDPHRGFVRCLAQGEKSPIMTDDDAGTGDGAAPDAGDGGAPSGSAGDAGSSDGAAPDAAPPAPAPASPPSVEMKPPKFENGDVPKAEKALSGAKLLDAIAKCVGDAGGLSGKTGSLKVEFLVRARGKAEGVEVKPQNVPQAAAQCVRTLLKNRTIGIPSADPTGVTVIYNLKSSDK